MTRQSTTHSRLRSSPTTALLIALLFVLSNAGAVGGAVSAQESLASCRADFLADTTDWNGCACFYQLANDPELRDQVRVALSQLDKEVSVSGCPAFYLGSLEFADGSDPGVHFRRAAQIYRANGHWKGVYYARMSLGRWYRGRSDFDRALEQMEYGVAAAKELGDAGLADATEFENLSLALERGGDLATTEQRLVTLLERVSDGQRPRRESEVIDLLAQTRYRLGDLEQARTTFERLAARHQESGDGSAEATALFNSALCRLEGRPSEADRSRALERLRATLGVAWRSGNLRIEAAAQRMLGRLTPGPAGQERLRQSVDISRRLGESQALYSALLAYAERVAESSPSAARELSEDALELVPEDGAVSFLANGWLHRLRIEWATSGPNFDLENALDSSFEILDEVEELRARQDEGRAEFFSIWLPAHQWLAGRLYGLAGKRSVEATRTTPLEGATPVPVAFADLDLDRLSQAFLVSERMRSRILLETLDIGNAGTPENGGSGENTFDLESLVDIETTQATLAPDEALLSWHLALWDNVYRRFEGGSWLVAIHRGGVGLYALPDAAHLDPAIAHFRGLFEARDGGSESIEQSIAKTLERQIIAAALDDLPETVKNLVLVADGSLTTLPFGALRNGEGEALAARYSLVSAPSATLWAHWRSAGREPLSSDLLVLADPDLSARSDGKEWPELPGARREAKAISRQFGASAQVLVGPEAVEEVVRAVRPGEYGILHFGAHAVVSEGRGRRSGILLTPSEAESSESDRAAFDEGLLDSEEIAGLDLAGEVAVLAACRSGGGRVLYGEGPLSLARAFFQGGAGAVVASLWPLRDDEAAVFFESFYRHLGHGVDLSTALTEVQRELIAAGVPTAGWAGVVLLGDGAVVPFPGGVSRRRSRVVWLSIIASLATLSFGFRQWFVRRRRNSTPPS